MYFHPFFLLYAVVLLYTLKARNVGHLKPSQKLVVNSDLIYKKLRVEFLKNSIRSVPNKRMSKSNAADLAKEYGFQDLDGSTRNIRSISVLCKVYEYNWTSHFIPSVFVFPYFLCIYVVTRVFKGQDVPLSLCPRTRAGSKIPGQTPLFQDVPSQDKITFPPKKTKNRKRTF